MAQLPEWAKELWKPSRYKVMRGGRGSAKSRSAAAALLLQAASYPHRVLCAREIQKSIKDSVKRLLDDEIDRLGLNDFFESTENEIRGKNGSLFIFAGLRGNSASVKSMEGISRCWVEEAQTISRGSLDDLIPTIRADKSEIWFTYNPRLDTDPIDVMFKADELPPSTILIHVNWQQNPWFPDVLRQEMEYDKRRDMDKYLHIWEGQYQTSSEARVFKNWTVQEFEVDKTAVIRQGADWGFSVDPTVLVQAYITGRTLYVPWEIYRVGCDIVDTPALFMGVPESEKWPMVADSSRPETISHLQKNGFPKIIGAIKGARSVEEGVEFLKSFDIVVHPRCKHLIDELTLYSFEVDKLTGEVLPKLADKDNHVIDALRYALEGARRARPAPNTDVHKINKHRHAHGAAGWMG
jgi:phage terminase large subunit